MITTPHPNLAREIDQWLKSDDSVRCPLAIVGPPRSGKSTTVKAAAKGAKVKVLLGPRLDADETTALWQLITGVQGARVIIESNAPVKFTGPDAKAVEARLW